MQVTGVDQCKFCLLNRLMCTAVYSERFFRREGSLLCTQVSTGRLSFCGGAVGDHKSVSGTMDGFGEAYDKLLVN